MATDSYPIQRLAASDLRLMQQLLDCFSEAFDEPENYTAKRPPAAYLTQLLDKADFIALVARDGEQVIGGLAAYELVKFEQVRSEIYVYDLAVAEHYRRQSVATALLKALKPIAREKGAWISFIQADRDDAPAVALYSKLGSKEEVLHFDLPVND